MLKEEFLKITGLNDIDDSEYREIESVYDNVSADKKEFLDAWYGEDEDALDKMQEYCKELSDHLNYWRVEAQHKKDAAENIATMVILGTGAEAAACAILGDVEVAKLKLCNDIPLSKHDKQVIIDNLD